MSLSDALFSSVFIDSALASSGSSILDQTVKKTLKKVNIVSLAKPL